MNKQWTDWLNKVIVLLGLITLSLAVRIPPHPRTQISNNDQNVITPNDLTDKDVELNYQLSDSTRPTNYKITLKPDLDKTKLSFEGTVEITIKPQYKTKIIELNAKNLTDLKPTITVNAVSKRKDDTLKITGKLVEEVEKYILTTDKDLDNNKEYTLTITYKGTLNHADFKGFYKSSYINDKNEEVIIGTTQFESSGARRAFPCYDEIGIKATFEIIIIANEKFNNVISNTQGESVTKAGLTTTTFKKTPVPMSTYLVAFVVSDFEKKKSSTVEMSIYSQKKFIAFADRSLKFSELVIDEIRKFLNDISYFSYMEKLDQVGIPDFAAGAMENWGLVTYRELQLLWDEKTATSWTKQKIYLTIAHEFAHQWFGNLVTPTWWKYIWLNEGFATYIEYVAAQEAVNKLKDTYKESDWRLLDHFAIHERQTSFISDSLTSTRPMTYFAESPEAVNGLFDNVIYAKAGSVLFMLEHILSKEVFQRGLNSYLKKNEKKSVTPELLWDALQEEHEKYLLEKPEIASNLGRLSVHDIGNSWSLQAGYPIVNVTKEGDIVKLEQKRFLTDSEKETDTLFLIPINYVLQSKIEDISKTQPQAFLTTKSRSIQVEAKDDFILVNNLQTGYYRVNYDLENWKKIIKYTNDTEKIKNLPPVTLSQIIDDTLVFARVGVLPYSLTLQLVEFLQHVDDYVPWYAAINNFKHLDVQFSGSSAEYNYLIYQRKLLTNVYEKIQSIETKDLTHLDKLNRLLLLKRACDVDVSDCRNKTNELLKEHIPKAKKESIVPDDQLAFYCGGARLADEETYEGLIKLFKGEDKDDVEKKNLILGMGCMNDESLLEKFLDASSDDLKTHVVEVFSGMIDSGRTGLEFALKYYTKHYEHLVETHGEDKMITILQAFGNKCASNDHLKSVNTLAKMDDNEDSKLRKELTRTVAKIEQRIDWNDKYLDDINEWFVENDYVAGGATIVLNLTLLSFGFIVTYLFNIY